MNTAIPTPSHINSIPVHVAQYITSMLEVQDFESRWALTTERERSYYDAWCFHEAPVLSERAQEVLQQAQEISAANGWDWGQIVAVVAAQIKGFDHDRVFKKIQDRTEGVAKLHAESLPVVPKMVAGPSHEEVFHQRQAEKAEAARAQAEAEKQAAAKARHQRLVSEAAEFIRAQVSWQPTTVKKTLNRRRLAIALATGYRNDDLIEEILAACTA